MKLTQIVSAAAIAAAALTAPAANAAFIIGGVSFGGGFDVGAFSNLPNSIVSGLNAFDVSPVALGVGGTGNLVPAAVLAAAFDFDKATPPTTLFTSGGFIFTVLSYGPSAIIPFACVTAQCTDTIGFNAFGQVSGNGFQTTGFTMSWSAQGSCNELGVTNTCDTGATASWSASISATGSEPPTLVPEPSALALVGLALAGLAFTTRRRAAK